MTSAGSGTGGDGTNPRRHLRLDATRAGAATSTRRAWSQRRELEYAAQRLSSVEINGSFYSSSGPTSYAAWRDADARRLRLRGQGRSVHHPHEEAARTSRPPLANFFASGVLALGAKLGPLLWQLPAEPAASTRSGWSAFFDLLPRTTGGGSASWPSSTTTRCRRTGRSPRRHASTCRSGTRWSSGSETFCTEESFDADAPPRHRLRASPTRPGSSRWSIEQTSDFVYVRLHGDTELYTSGYSPQALDRWAEQVPALGRGRRRLRLLRQRRQGARTARRGGAAEAARPGVLPAEVIRTAVARRSRPWGSRRRS